MSFDKLDNQDQRTFAHNCVERRKAYETFTHYGHVAKSKDILIVGDRPGPKAHQGDDHHHTPFYSKKWSGGWLNAELVKAGITEDRLLWINSATWDGKPTDAKILTRRWLHVFALGGNASKWLEKNNCLGYFRYDHPQYHKRFKNKEVYQFLPDLKAVLNRGPHG